MKLPPARIALIYFGISFIWITVSDRLIWNSFHNLNNTIYFSTLKGIFFISLSSWLIYALIKNYSVRLNQTEKDYQLLLRSNPQPMWIFEYPSLRFVAVNEAAIEFYGYSKKEFLQMTVLNMRHPEDHDQLKELIGKVGEKANTNIGIWRHIKKNGEWVYVQVNSNIIRFNGKDCRISSGIDVTSEQLARLRISELNKELTEYRHAIDSAAIVSITNLEGAILHVNKNFEQISGYSEKELIGKNHNIIKSGHHSKEFYQELWLTIKSGKVWRGLVKNKSKHQRFFWCDSSIIPILNQQNAISHFICFRYDVTDRITSELQLREHNAKLKEIAWISSHELRHPLASMLGLIQLFDKSNLGSSEHKELMDFLESTCNKLDEQIHAIVARTNLTLRSETIKLTSENTDK
jgi:PAS domain S-box-containing protein